MKLERVSLERTFNLGNYESLRVELEASLTEADNPLNILRNLEDMAELYLQTRLQKTEPTRTVPKGTTIQDVHAVKPKVLEQFPPEYRDLLSLSGGKIFCQYVSKEKWNEINQAARGLGYEWVSNGKDSHWRLKK